MTKTGIGQGNATTSPFFAYMYRNIYSLKEAADATASEQHNETTNAPPQGTNLQIQEDGNDVTCAKGSYEDNSGDNFYTFVPHRQHQHCPKFTSNNT